MYAKAPGSSSAPGDRKSTRLNSSHANISYAVFCLKKKKNSASTWLYVLAIFLFSANYLVATCIFPDQIHFTFPPPRVPGNHRTTLQIYAAFSVAILPLHFILCL